MSDKIKLVLGTMTFGSRIDLDSSRMLVEKFIDNGHNELDTAYSYNKGKTEEILGDILSEIKDNSIKIATKINPRITGRLDGEAVEIQLSKSLERLNRDFVDILYFHFPDPYTPIEDALETSAKLFEQGKFKKLGLSNFPAWQVVDIWHLCDKNGWPKPSVYQGMYNGLTRKTEKELFPALRELKMSFYAFNPLAGGILTGKYNNFDETPSLGRFTNRPNYKDRYWKKSFFKAIETLSSECQKKDIKLAEAAYRWLAFHSKLEEEFNDGILIGASSIKQLDQNLSSISQGELPNSVVEAFNKVWDLVKYDSPDYFRYNIK